MKTAGRVILALIGGILFPILIWVALEVALGYKRKEQKKMETIGEILARAGLSLHND